MLETKVFVFYPDTKVSVEQLEELLNMKKNKWHIKSSVCPNVSISNGGKTVVSKAEMIGPIVYILYRLKQE